jgi:hypothetical protein
VASITILIRRLRKPGALASSVYFPAAKPVNNVSPSVSEGDPTTSYPSLGVKLISAAPRNWLLSSSRSLTLSFGPATLVEFAAGLVDELNCEVGDEGDSGLRSCPVAGRTITAASVSTHAWKTKTRFRAGYMAKNLPFFHIYRHGPFHAKCPVNFQSGLQTFSLSAIRPGYPSVIVRQSIASPGFCQVNSMRILNPSHGQVEYSLSFRPDNTPSH